MVSVAVRCPQCDFEADRTVTEVDLVAGERIWVSRLTYLFRAPARYEVVAFRFPGDPSRRFVKRLVGLPGETLEVRNGDLFVNGQLAPKPPAVQDRLWIPVHAARAEPQEAPRAWRALPAATLHMAGA